MRIIEKVCLSLPGCSGEMEMEMSVVLLELKKKLHGRSKSRSLLWNLVGWLLRSVHVS